MALLKEQKQTAAPLRSDAVLGHSTYWGSTVETKLKPTGWYWRFCWADTTQFPRFNSDEDTLQFLQGVPGASLVLEIMK